MKLFTLGPVEMYEHTKSIGSLQNEYFRDTKFSNFMYETDMLLKKALFAPSEYHTMFLTCSGTGAMESTIINCFTSNDKLLVINGGTFGGYFVNICKYNQIPYEEISLKFGTPLIKKFLEPHEGESYTALLVNICETSTGQLYDIDLLSDFCKRNKMFLIVDAISSAFADEYNITKYDIDATIISSQKALALPPGLAVSILSDRIYNDRVVNNNVKSMYFDFKAYNADMKRGQTPFTPCIGILYQLNDMLKQILKQGVANKINETKSLADYFRRMVVKSGINIPSYALSNALTPILFDTVDAYDVYKKLRDDFNIYINPNGFMSDYICRVGHLGNLTSKDFDMLLYALNKVVEDLSQNK